MDILLTHAYLLDEDPLERRIMRPYVPLGILSIGAWLIREGYSVEMFDTTFRSLQDVLSRLESSAPPVVGISVNMMTKGPALRLIAAAKRAGSWVIVGGPEPGSYAEEYLASGADVVVVGEGERTAADLLRHRKTGFPTLAEISGIVYSGPDGNPLRTPPRELIPDLNILPMPARDAVDMAPYLQSWRAAHGTTSLSLVTMRGCPYGCTWCSHTVYGESYRRRSPALVAEELTWMQERYRPDSYWFADDVFTISHRWIGEFEAALRVRSLSIRYECISRADRLNADVFRSLRTTGCTRIWIGSESGSQRMLDAMNRGVRVDQVRAAVRLARRNGIEVGMFIMLGYPGGTAEDIEETVRHLAACRPDVVLTTVAYPIKGTPLYAESIPRLQFPSRPWREWNDRAIGIAGRSSSRYYWFANRRIINEAAWTRMMARSKKRWLSIAAAFLKAKVASAGMRMTR